MKSCQNRTAIFSWISKITPVGFTKPLALILAGLLLAGCGSTFKRVQTWEGPEADPSQVATLDTPSQINVTSVNGRKTSNFLLEDLALTYELLPGENTVIFNHKTIWANSAANEEEDSKVIPVVSGPQAVVIDAQAGESYQIVVPEPENRRDAERLAASFRATIVDGQGHEVASAAAYSAPKPELPTLQESSDPTPVVTGDTADSALREQQSPSQEQVDDAAAAPAPMNDLPTLDAMKLLWERASADDKKNFLRWAFE